MKNIWENVWLYHRNWWPSIQRYIMVAVLSLKMLLDMENYGLLRTWIIFQGSFSISNIWMDFLCIEEMILNILRHIVWMYHSILSICFWWKTDIQSIIQIRDIKEEKVKICGIPLKVEIQDCIRIFSLHTLSLLILQVLQIMSLHSQHGSS